MVARKATRRTARRRAAKRRVKRKTARKRTTKRRVTRRKRKASRKVVRRRRKARKTKTGSKIQVFRGSRMKTSGGLMKSDIIVNKRGRFVSKKANAHGKRVFKRNLAGWNKAFMQAREALNVKGFSAVKKGTPLYKKTMEFYKN